MTDEWAAIVRAGLQPESEALRARLEEAPFTYAQRQRVLARARQLVEGCRRRADERSLLDLFLQEYGLSNEEGIALLCISEALLRIPDDDTAEALIAEKIGTANWAEHVGQSDSVFLNASTWALMLTGNVIGLADDVTVDVGGWINRLTGRIGESVARAAMSRAVRIVGGEFVQGRTIEEALARERSSGNAPSSFDMLGEGARTYEDAHRYTESYRRAIRAVGDAYPNATPTGASGISIKLSALHPRYEPLQRQRVLAELGPTLLELAREAAERNIHLTVDAEEAQRLELSLELFEGLARDRRLAGWEGLGIAVQAYSKRAPAVIDWLDALGRPVMVRLVKGAYWDTEIKHAQVEGLGDYPVYTRKASTDLAYLACAARLFGARRLFAQFATHNAHTVAAVLELARGGSRPYEFQRLHGMGELLYDEARRRFEDLPSVRVYAPVGAHKDLLAYLVRRLLENGANSSFVNRFLDDKVDVGELVRDPLESVADHGAAPHPLIPLPAELYGAERRNSSGLDIGNGDEVDGLLRSASTYDDAGIELAETDVDEEFARAAAAFRSWESTPATARRACLDRLAQLIEGNRERFVALLANEAGKTLVDAIAEVREAADFCRYYGAECERLFGGGQALPGPTGESNTLELHGRGVFACISPWNFPLAIFTGQIVAALAAGNTVVAKPAPQTPRVASVAVALMREAGIPEDAVRLAFGGVEAGAAVVGHDAVAGVAFTGSTATAKHIQRSLADKAGPLVPFVAETGGQNAMVVDSTALPEQVVDDVLASAFRSAGQRCSSLRVLYVQQDIAAHLIEMIVGAMRTLILGDPADPMTDIGPVIDGAALDRLEAHVDALREKVVFQCPVPAGVEGLYAGPTLIEIDSIADLDGECFGPVLHVCRFAAAHIDRALADIQNAGYGLTLGIHSRIHRRADEVMAAVKVGNTYVNRDMIGATVGVQPFGGEGLSGTGPKAGGPNYLPRFAVERSVTWNTTATGGNTELLSLPD
ncbi:MAG: L-glutamate gamma-semialdehyde dehydrogenase [Gammaproteobacteria bacterium]|nr:L-glutamate gamma-semialdehyde dehydrogenase [Gammaproteobacteria bacterium]